MVRVVPALEEARQERQEVRTALHDLATAVGTLAGAIVPEDAAAEDDAFGLRPPGR